MPSSGNSRKPSATGASGLPEVGCSLRAVCVFVVWMVNVTGVTGLPTAMVRAALFSGRTPAWVQLRVDYGPMPRHRQQISKAFI
jgi:hypothetical protein